MTENHKDPEVEGYDAPQEAPDDDVIEAAHRVLEETDQDVFDNAPDEAEPGHGEAIS